jgi:hypothetical protein
LRRTTSPAAAEVIRVRAADFDYQLPDEMIAQTPPETRAAVYFQSCGTLEQKSRSGAGSGNDSSIAASLWKTGIEAWRANLNT